MNKKILNIWLIIGVILLCALIFYGVYVGYDEYWVCEIGPYTTGVRAGPCREYSFNYFTAPLNNIPSVVILIISIIPFIIKFKNKIVPR